ncbi:hypothetical protein [Candidatus Palauibacter sp.]|uniref:hypothetical protein n=1 Tax=Candidatus Palauibacter sp. TaxID=3101350 RepID=UPI003C6F259E
MAEDHAFFLNQSTKAWLAFAVSNAVKDCADIADGSYHAWVVYTDLMEPCGPVYGLGRGGNSNAWLGAWDLVGLTDPEYSHCGQRIYGPNRWIGGLAHEMGHAFGLPHPPGCDEGLSTCDHGALMATGYADWPNTYLRDDEKEVLLEGRFMNSEK